MAIIKLVPRAVEKPWGRTDLPAHFGAPKSEPIGEIWFEHPGGDTPPLLVKYLFTSAALSVQVHPDDAQAALHATGSGKEEAWVITASDPGASIGLGLKEKISDTDLRNAALDGSIEQLLDWRAVDVGEHFHVTPGTIHAIGAGLTLIEVQQYADTTYRLYDYGRPRELHLDHAVEAANAEPYTIDNSPFTQQDGSDLLIAGPKFRLVRHHWRGTLDSPPQRIAGAWWFVPMTGTGSIGDMAWQAGDCFLVDEAMPIIADQEATALFACAVN